MSRRRKDTGSILAEIIILCLKIAFLPVLIFIKIGNSDIDYMADNKRHRRRRRRR